MERYYHFIYVVERRFHFRKEPSKVKVEILVNEVKRTKIVRKYKILIRLHDEKIHINLRYEVNDRIEYSLGRSIGED